MRLFLSPLVAGIALLAGEAAAQAVFAHHIVGNTASYTTGNWEDDIRLAASKGIDAFALNIAPPLEGTTGTQVKNAFDAAANVGGEFRLFFSFDYEGGGQPWAEGAILSLLQQYGSNEYHYQYDGRPFTSTFEGPGNADMNMWSSIRASLPSGLYLVPDWTSQGPGWNQNLVDGYFSWDMWPVGANNMTTDVDENYQATGVSYMMGVSPWFFTDLPGYGKSWVWRGDGLWAQRWQQVLDVLPQFVEIVTWNDFGESHYIGPIYEPGVPQGDGTDALRYVQGMPHSAWMETLPYQITAYKHAFARDTNPAPQVKEDKIVYWYRLNPASAGTTEATGNNCPSPVNAYPYQDCAPIAEVLEDAVFAIALLSAPGSVTISIGDAEAGVFDGLQAGLNFVSVPWGGKTGVVSVTSSSGVSGNGEAIEAEPPGGVANFNAWVGCAGACT